MSDMIIRNARLLDPASGRDETGEIGIVDGVFSAAGTVKNAAGVVEIDAQGLCLTPGLIDLRVKTGEPGASQKETLATASAAAVSGGVTSMVVMPDTDPVIDDVALVEFIARRGESTGVNRIYPAGALTRGLAGEAMTEIGLMQEAGAVFFSNGETSLANAAIMKRVMSYAASLGAAVCVRAEDADLIGSGVMNAGALAARMGLAGMSRDAEYVMGLRDLVLAEATGCRLIIDQVSCPNLLAAITDFAKRGADVHCTVAAHHLFFNELDVGDYRTHCKVSPPLRDEATRLALIDAVASGAVGAVVSAHNPQPPEEKRVPFADAAFGAVGLETLLAAMLSLAQDDAMSLLDALRPLTIGPANLAGLSGGTLAEGAQADFILFDPNKPWVCDGEALLSRSKNTPFDGRRLMGRVIETYVGGTRVFQRS